MLPSSSSSSKSSRPISINPKHEKTTFRNKNGQPLAASCPTFSWCPPPPPTSRPRIAEFDPPPMALPPSPPVLNPLMEQNNQNNNSTATATTKQTSQSNYSRSLSNYSSSAPTNIDYLQKSKQLHSSILTKPSVFPSNDINQLTHNISNIKINTKNTNEMSLSKSPTIFSILRENDKFSTNKKPSVIIKNSSNLMKSSSKQIIEKNNNILKQSKSTASHFDDLQFEIEHDESSNDNQENRY